MNEMAAMDENTTRQLEEFLSEYQTYIESVLRPTQRELQEVFRSWRAPEHWAEYMTTSRQPIPSPVQRAITRIKRPESVVDKILRKSMDYPKGLVPDSFRHMHDAIAGRVIVYFLGNLPLIDREMQQQEHFELSSSLRPIAYLSEELTTRLSLEHLRRDHKTSGYVSIHYVVRLKSSIVPDADRPWFEIQVRTLTEDVWGEIEHVLGYKPQKRTLLAVTRQFQILSALLGTVDEQFNFLFEELSRFQEEASFRDSDPLNAENLPSVLAEGELGCAQKEIDGLLKLLTSRGVNLVGMFRELATPDRIQIIRSTYVTETGRQPVDFEVIATLAALRNLKTKAEEVTAIKQQIAYNLAWSSLQSHFHDVNSGRK